jgi:AraC family transcriptional regulator of adaptative response/methylated-DNA-[protein]-cysteine methyltransferase
MEDLEYQNNMQNEDYYIVEKAIRYIEACYDKQPSLEEIAAHVNLSQYHFQRVFSRWAGISPKKFLQFITINQAKRLLDESASILETANQVGLSSTSRLHDLFVNFEAITPGEYKECGEGLHIRYGFHQTPFGECLLALTERGICGLNFADGQSQESLLSELKNKWFKSNLIEAPEVTIGVMEKVYNQINNKKQTERINLLLKGTNFQIKVWEALLKVPFGTAVSYKNIASLIDEPKAARAVGTAVGNNPIAFIIPCHRVISQIGSAYHYRWGGTRKKIILGWEASKKE